MCGTYHGCVQSRGCGELDGVSTVFEPVERIIEFCGVGFSSLHGRVFVVVGHDVVSLGSHPLFIHASAMRTQGVSQRIDGGFRHFFQGFRHVYSLFFFAALFLRLRPCLCVLQAWMGGWLARVEQFDTPAVARADGIFAPRGWDAFFPPCFSSAFHTVGAI